MKLFKVENENEIWYFSTIQKASTWLGTGWSNVNLALKGVCTKCKGYTVEEVEEYDILCKYIDPEPGTHNKINKQVKTMKSNLVKQTIDTDTLDEFYGQGCRVKIEQECIEDNQATTHIELTDTYGWQSLVVKQTCNKEIGNFGKITFDVIGNWESRALAQAFIEIGKNILNNYKEHNI